MKNYGFTFFGSRLIYLDGGTPTQTSAEQPAPAPEAVPVQQEVIKAPEQLTVNPDTATQENTKTKEAAAKRFLATLDRLNILANITV